MENRGSSGSGGGWWIYAIPLLAKDGRGYLLQNTDDMFSAWPLYVAILLVAGCAVVVAWLSPGGCAWAARHNKGGNGSIPGPRGFPIIGSLIDMSRGLAHRRLAQMARIHDAKKLMAFSLGSTPAVITSDPEVARELLSSVHFADRPLKQSAQQLMFGRAIGFAPNGEYWRMLRRISATHLFAPRRIAAHEPGRQADSLIMLKNIHEECVSSGVVRLRRHLQAAALNNIMGSVFGRRFDICSESEEVTSLRKMVEEGFELLGAFNWADHLPWLRLLDPLRIHSRCASLVPRVRGFVRNIIEEHRLKASAKDKINDNADSDFVHVLLSLNGEDKLDDEDMISVLWEMIFRGTDTTALLTEWTMAEMVRNPEAQRKVQEELECVVGNSRSVSDSDICKLPYLQAVVKETLRMHPPGPLLSWARLSTCDTIVGDGMFSVPAGTTAMVNMWSITHDPLIWDSPDQFRAERFLVSEGGENVDVRGNDLRLAPFGAGRRVCPGKALGLTTVHLWVAKLLHHFHWVAHEHHPVDLSEVLKLSCEMVHPLHAVPILRLPLKP